MTAAHNGRDVPMPNGAKAGHDGQSPSAPSRGEVPRTRAGGLWVAAVVFALVLLLLLIFVLQNGRRAEVSFLGAHGHLPMGVALLLAAVFGILLVALPGTARIVQLRILGHRRLPHAAAGPSTAPVASPTDDPTGQRTHG